MSDVKKLSDVFKASEEVTSLESTDRVLVVDANGNPKRIRRDRLAAPYVYFNKISTQQWVRVGKFSSGTCALIKVFSVWRNVPGNNILIDMLLHPNAGQYNAVTVLSRMSNSANYLLPKLRVVRKCSSECYIDVYYNGTTEEFVYFYLIHGPSLTLLTPEPDAQIPEGYTSVEFDISTVSSGGVKLYRSTTYTIRQKGGRRNGGNEVNYQRFPFGGFCGRGGEKRQMRGFQRIHDPWILYMLQPEERACNGIVGCVVANDIRQQHNCTVGSGDEWKGILPSELGRLAKLAETTGHSRNLNVGKGVAA